MSDIPRQETSPDPYKLPASLHEPDRALFAGWSMRRVFTPGDVLVLREIPFADFRRGDIVAYGQGDRPGVVHRLIRREDDKLILQGDNNDAPDARTVTAEDSPRLVIGRIPSGSRKVRLVARGQRGMIQFRCNRLRRFCRKATARLGRLLLGRFWDRLVATIMQTR